MSEKHTQGPWRYVHAPGYCGELIAQDGTTIAEFVVEPSSANARRIVACVNACDGIPTAWIEGGAADILEHSIALIKQRDELLAMLKKFTAVMDGCANWPDTTCTQVKLGEIANDASAAIAKITGEKNEPR